MVCVFHQTKNFHSETGCAVSHSLAIITKIRRRTKKHVHFVMFMSIYAVNQIVVKLTQQPKLKERKSLSETKENNDKIIYLLSIMLCMKKMENKLYQVLPEQMNS